QHRALATLAHALYETDELRLNDLRLVRQCTLEPGFSWDDIERRAGQDGSRESFHAIAALMAPLQRALLGASCCPVDLTGRRMATVTRAMWIGEPLRALERAHGTPRMPWRLPKIYSKAHFVARLMTQPERAPEQRVPDLLWTGWNLIANRWHLRSCPGAVVA